jgi:hypothetical protein
MPRRKKSSLSAIQNLSHTTTHLNHQDSLADDHPPDIQAETGDAANVEEALGEVEYLGDVAGEEIWQEDAVMELIGVDLEDLEEKRAKSGWHLLYAGLAAWEKKVREDKADSYRPNRPTKYYKNSKKTLDKKRKEGIEHGLLDFGEQVSAFANAGGFTD